MSPEKEQKSELSETAEQEQQFLKEQPPWSAVAWYRFVIARPL